ncbi:MAG: hypothetical protein B2I18_01215 [Cuniculiplasma sp. C_DKE]|nr:MAG: hypothetical protein B2I18_01215 [Cuniculiplasma sp. C_DKE]
MDLEEKAGLICVLWDIFLIFSAIYIPSVWYTLFWLLESGNIFLEVIGGIGIAAAIIGAMIMVIALYYAIVYIFLAIAIIITLGAPAVALYYFLGLEHSLILAGVITAVVFLYLIETRTVRVEHHTVTIALNKRYVIKR